MNTIKELRLQQGLSQAQVAKKLGLTQQSYSRYEIEGVTPSAEILSKIADYYNVTVDYLLGRKNEEPNYFLLARDMSTLNPQDLNTIKELVAFMKTKNNKDK